MERKGTDVRTTRELVKRLKEAKIINLDTPIGQILDETAEQPGMDEVAGYVCCWDKYVIVIGSQLEEKKQIMEK